MQESCTVEARAHIYGGFGGVEAANNTFEGFERGEGVQWGNGGDVGANSGQGGGVEERRVCELRDDEGVRRRRWLNEGREVGERERERRL